MMGTELAPWAETEWRSVSSSLTMGQPLSREEVYRSVEDLCVEGYAGEVYERVARTMFAAAATRVRVSQGPDLLGDVAKAWAAHCEHTQGIAAMCLYLDRSYAQKEAVGLWEAGAMAFRRALRGEPGLEAAVVARIRDVAKSVRGGDSSENLASTKACCAMLCELHLYVDLLEPLLLRDARDFYAAQGRRLSSETADARAYAALVLETLADADAAVELYLPSRTLGALQKAVDDHLVAPHVARIYRSAFPALVDAKDDAVLGDLYRLLHRVHNTDVAKSAVKDLAMNRITQKLLTPSATTIKDVLAVHKRLTTLCATRLLVEDDGDDKKKKKKKSWGPGVLKDAFEEAVNADAAAAPFAETLAAYFANAVSTDGKLEGAMLLFRYSRSKDVFEAFFRRDLADRLLASRAAAPATTGSSPTMGKKKQDLEHERRAIAALEAECGASYVSKLEGMCNDLDLAKTLAGDYGRDREPTKIDLVPLVLTTGYWPSYTTTLTLPALDDAKEAFAKYYTKKFQGRRLHWHMHLGRCVLRGTFGKKKRTYQLDATPSQAAVLCALDDAGSSLADLTSKTGLDDVELGPVVASLKNANLLVGSLRVNRAFHSKSILNKLPSPEATRPSRPDDSGGGDRTKIIDAVSRDRQYAVDAAIVRVMKARKTLPHQQLLADVLARLKHPATPADIKLRIESLIDREYLERDDGGGGHYYNYLA